MTNKNNKRFANRETTVKGYVIDLTTQTQTAFEVQTPYTRSNDKAVTFAREALQLDENPMVIVAVTEIVNQSPKPIKYNNGKIYDLCEQYYSDKEEAEKAAEIDGFVVRAIPWYEISGQVWAIDADGNYHTDFFADTTPVNMTKIDQRDFMRIAYEDFSGQKVIALHNVNKEAVELYCEISPENLEKCIEQ